MITIIGICCLLYGAFLAIRANSALKHNSLKLQRKTQTPSFAFLIPARYESAVIEGLLKSIATQTIPVKMSDVYVIIENMEDPTVQICRKYHCSIILRQHLDLQRKGYALDEAVKQILAHKHYDLYFIFDADNRLSPTYLAEMLKIYAVGYQMATGYRSSKNNNRNVITAVSALTFTMINTMGNKNRICHAANIIFSGTGCFISGDLVESWQGWPFHSLTEDYEMSLYAMVHNISTFYNEKAIFYDEQPTTFAQTVDQRVRWIRGYFDARKIYIPQMHPKTKPTNYGSLLKERIGVKPIIWALIGVICLLLSDIVKLFTDNNFTTIMLMLVGIIILVYLVLLIVTIILIRKEKMHLTNKNKWRVILFNPIYLITYIPCALKALLTKNVTWKRIEHGKKSK